MKRGRRGGDTEAMVRLFRVLTPRICYYAFMRTTVDLPDDLFRRAKAKASMGGISLRELIEAGVRHMLAEPEEDLAGQRQAWLARLDELFAKADQRDAKLEGSAGPFSRDELYAGRLDRFR